MKVKLNCNGIEFMAEISEESYKPCKLCENTIILPIKVLKMKRK